MLNDEIKKKIQLKKRVKSTMINMSNLDHKIKITPYKINQNKL